MRPQFPPQVLKTRVGSHTANQLYRRVRILDALLQEAQEVFTEGQEVFTEARPVIERVAEEDAAVLSSWRRVEAAMLHYCEEARGYGEEMLRLDQEVERTRQRLADRDWRRRRQEGAA